MPPHFTPNILQVCLSPYWGGMEKFCLDLSLQLNKTQNTSILLQKESPLEEQAQGLELQVFSLNFINYIDLPAMIKIRKLVLKHKIDIVHFHGSSEMGLLTPALFGLNQVKLINHKHIFINSNKKNLYHRLIYKRANHIIALSNRLKNNILEKYPVKESCISVLPNAIDPLRFIKKEYPPLLTQFQTKQSETLFISTISRLAKGKGLENFIQVANNMISKNQNLYFFIVGKGTSTYKMDLENLVEPSCKKNIIFTGYQENIPAILSETDLFLFLSEGEAFPLSILEAMIMQKKIIARNVRGVVDLLSSYAEDCLVKPDEELDSICKKITQTLDDKKTKCDYQVKPYYFEHYLPKLLQLYRA